jgi:hypothetical protein
MKSYTLVNPQLKGSIDVEFKCNSAIEAANLAYDSISKYFSNNVPNFSFTLQKGGSKFFHFDVKEKINRKDKIKFQIKENSTITNIDGLVKFIKINEEELEGGYKDDKHDKHDKHSKKYKFDEDDSSSSSESSEDDDYYYYKPITRNMPITYWSYYPYVYNLKKVYIPTFVPTVTPYVYIAYE